MNPELIVVTPTRDRPEAFRLARRWMANQTYPKAFDWFIADDGDAPALPMDEVHSLGLVGPSSPRPEPIRATYYRHAPRQAACTLHDNLEDFLAWLRRDRAGFDGWIAFWEDDEYYAPRYLETMMDAARANGPGLVGISDAHYWHVATRRWHHGGSFVHSSLCRTFLHARALPHLAAAIAKTRREKSVFIDLELWASARHRFPVRLLEAAWRLSIGIKGLPGRGGLGRGHKPEAYKNPDPEGTILREWIGADADVYLAFQGKGKPACP